MAHGVGGRRVVTLVLPRPNPKVAHNGRAHWRVKAKHASEQRAIAALTARAVSWATKFDWCRITFRYINGKRVAGEYAPQDHQNAGDALKASIDGIVDSGLIPSDKANCVLYFGGELLMEKGGTGRVEIDIEEVWK